MQACFCVLYVKCVSSFSNTHTHTHIAHDHQPVITVHIAEQPNTHHILCHHYIVLTTLNYTQLTHPILSPIQSTQSYRHKYTLSQIHMHTSLSHTHTHTHCLSLTHTHYTMHYPHCTFTAGFLLQPKTCPYYAPPHPSLQSITEEG